MAKLICITGADGTGKSTLIQSLAPYFPQAYTATVWDLLKNGAEGLPFRSKQQVDSYLCSLTPDSRLLFLAHAMKYAVDQAQESHAEAIIIDSYFYKYTATELALGADRLLARHLGKTFPLPDRTLLLELPLSLMAERKARFSRYECGLAAAPGPTEFLAFQAKVLAEWQHFSIPNVQRLDARLPKEELSALAIQKINHL